MPVSTSDLAEQLSSVHDLSKADAKKIVEAVFADITDAVAKGDEVSINGFGKFKVKDSPERQGRNPATGEAITIAASRKISFAPAKQVRDRLNGG
ncbi:MULTISPECIES: HU family DNA-binding protein [Sphingomonadaceae]|jgi:DNA-binding protein HU-beta|uniref:HU family DNA-binding protein n=1 Tax=Novosphingobium clariflavum TaxID=2029884 RepID=A0ABV6S422_9SPHN|nr:MULTISPECIES: HU family DNA-binding protein [Sphingomonadaceae]RSU72953.1 HU family DNA-binding protein [Sphingomonas sp. S-NIH.Pt3_0716]MBP8233785.1 HU family DNA-binding protein [Rhizorhabdus sp.]MDG2514769.1 HU family DNA-binding protein [Sphingobium yanoikuyae]PHP20724.1 HU family DNA-binding protein [Sphingobium sp. IP1]HAF43053.1 HU family DNA-binding protein [Sphingobium sp.]